MAGAAHADQHLDPLRQLPDADDASLAVDIDRPAIAFGLVMQRHGRILDDIGHLDARGIERVMALDDGNIALRAADEFERRRHAELVQAGLDTAIGEKIAHHTTIEGAEHIGNRGNHSGHGVFYP